MFDGSSIEKVLCVSKNPICIFIRFGHIHHFSLVAMRTAKAARLICDVYKPDGTPFEGDPQGLLKKVLAQVQEMGFTDFNVGPNVNSSSFLIMTKMVILPPKTFDRGAYFELGPTGSQVKAPAGICVWY